MSLKLVATKQIPLYPHPHQIHCAPDAHTAYVKTQNISSELGGHFGVLDILYDRTMEYNVIII